ncbi:hypothetical protein ACWF94_24880 [Streptomyces sp. NPDC055078]
MNCTDQAVQAGTARMDDSAAAVLVAVEQHFRTVKPTGVLESINLLVCVGAEAYNLVGRRMSGNALALATAAMALMPELREGITRGEYALLLRALVGSTGPAWTKDELVRRRADARSHHVHRDAGGAVMARETAAQLIAEAKKTYAASAPQRDPKAVAAAAAKAAKYAADAREARR